MTTTSPTSRIRLDGLDTDMVSRIERGQLTQAEAARLLGVSKQAVSKALKARKGKAATAPAPAPAKALPAPAERDPESQAQPGAAAPRLPPEWGTPEEAERFAISSGAAWRGLATNYVAMISEVNAYMAANRGKIGPVAMGGLGRVLREAEEGLRRLGMLAPVGGDREDGKPAELHVRVLSQGEEEQIRTDIAEQAGEGLADVPDDTPPAAPLPATPHRPVALIDRLPEAQGFEQWVAAQVHLKGAAWLRQIVAALGGQTAHGKDQLASELMRLTCGDPQRLLHLVGASA